MSKSILITGHTSGIGLALTNELISNGYSVFGISRGVTTVLPPSHQFQADLAQPAGIDLSCKFVLDKSVNQIVHCAGYNIIKDVAFIDLRRMVMHDECTLFFIGKTFSSVYNSSNKTLEQVLAISSIWASATCEQRSGYAMAKSALEKLVKQIAVEYHQDGILSIALRLGFVRTPLTAKTNDDTLLYPYKQRMLLGNKGIARPQEIAGFISTLINSPNRYVNGSVIDLNAGICSK